MKEGSFIIHGVRTQYQEWGDPDGPLILALHGWLDNSASFEPIAPYLPNHRIIALDIPGHGHSAHFSSDLPYHFIDAVIHIQALVETQSWQRLILFGHSLGGAIATLLAALIPDKIEKLIVIEGLGPISESAATAPEQVISYSRLAQKMGSRKARSYASLEACSQMRSKKGFVRLPEARILCARGTIETPEGWQWRHDPKLYLPSPIHLTENQVVAFLRKITAPTCFIIADDDGFRYDPIKIKGRTEAVKTLEIHNVPGGHHCHMEHPELIAGIVKGFI